jgi:hypothetical protein
MPKFSKSSQSKLATCHPDLQRLFNEVIKHVDIIIICGHRGQEEQDKAFANHTSMLKWPNGKHNKTPSLAVDVMPYPLEWDNILRVREVAMIIKQIASDMNIPVKWGGDWKSFKDLPHWEI